MAWFKKKERTHFERDASGKVVDVTRNGDPSPSYKPAKQLEKEYYQKHPEKRSYWQQHKARREHEKQVYQKSYEKARDIELRKRAGRVAHAKHYYTPVERLDRSLSGFAGTSYSTRNNFNPFGSTFDRGMPKPKKKSGKKYTVVGGKAYPIVGTGHKKKRKPKKRSSGHSLNTDDFFKL